ncbi:MAG TPA: hypothetical protein VGB84_05885 [Arachidicoccus sp.]
MENRISKKPFILKHLLATASIVLRISTGTYFLLNNPNNKTQYTAKEIVQNATIQQPVAINNDTLNLQSDKKDSLPETLLSYNAVQAKGIHKKKPDIKKR